MSEFPKLRASYTLPVRDAWHFEPLPPEPMPVPWHPAMHNVSEELCQLAAVYNPKHFPKRGGLVERKHHGIRAIWLHSQLVTRSGLPIWNSAHLWPLCQKLEEAFGEAMMFDGVFGQPGGFKAFVDAFTATSHASRPGEGVRNLCLFDAVPMPVWEGAERGAALKDRKRRLADMFAAAGDLPGLKLVPHWPVAGDDQARRLAAQAIAAGNEGVIVKDALSHHVAGRSRAWQKIKGKLSMTLRVIGHGPCKDDPDMLGFILCELDGRGVIISTGFSDDQRIRLMHYPERLFGRVAEVEASEITKAGQLRKAVFLSWRDDLDPGDVGTVKGRLP